MIPADIPIAVEAIALALPVEIGLRWLALDALLARLSGPRPPGAPRQPIDVDRAARIIERLGPYYPLRATCLKKSLVLFRILRRRGVPAELRLGVRKVEGDFNAHAWIELDGRPLLATGAEPSYRTLPLAPSPNRRISRSRFPIGRTE